MTKLIRYAIPALGFTLVSIASFSVWGLGGKWFGSAWSLYTSCAIVFLLAGGLSLLPFSGGEHRKPRWELLWLFPTSFIAYSILWCLCWFTFRSHFGELTGSALGILGMTSILKARLGFCRTIVEAGAVVFLFYTLGYYSGEKIYQDIGGLWGKLGWGFGFGIGMGAGLSYLVQLPGKSKN